MIRAGDTVAALLRHSPLPPLETRVLIAHALQLSRVQLITQSERVFTLEEAQSLSNLFQRRLRGEPIAYIVGSREFHGLDFYVTPDVLIPRPETELLVDLAIDRLPQGGRVLDLGTGSGAIAVAIAYRCPYAETSAIDVSEAALAIAGKNAARHGVRVRLLQSDWYEAAAGEVFDLIVANPPYIAADDPHLAQGDLRFEPSMALTDQADGLSALRAIIGNAQKHLTPNGWLLMEHGYDQAAAVRNLLETQGFAQVQSWKDLAGIERVSGGVAAAR
jgi:release factor glutamine methyltransferase